MNWEVGIEGGYERAYLVGLVMECPLRWHAGNCIIARLRGLPRGVALREITAMPREEIQALLDHHQRCQTATVIPTLRYKDAASAIEWLCEAFGFEKHLVVPAEDGTIVHAQLTFGNGMVMLGSARESEFDDLQKPPSALGRAVSQSS